jgi:hypothetical protein
MRGAIRYVSGFCSIVWILASPVSVVSAAAEDLVLLYEGQRFVIDLDNKTVGGIFWGRTSPIVDVTDNLIMWRQEWSTPGSSRPMRSIWIFNRATGHVMRTMDSGGAIARLRLSRCYSPALFLNQSNPDRGRASL